MLRKDVKLGFVIGGLLLTIVVIYVIFVDGSDRPQGAVLETEADEAIVADNAQPALPQVAEAVAPTEPQPTAPLIEERFVSAEDTTPPASTFAEDAWVLALNHGSVPPMMTVTPSPQQPSAVDPVAAQPGDARQEPAPVEDFATDENAVAMDQSAAQPHTTLDEPAMREDAGEVVVAENTDDAVDYVFTEAAPSSAPSRRHIVQRGESLARISELTYGSQAYWPHILRANPGIVAENIRPGMELILPDPADVKVLVADAALANTAAEPTIDPRRQYKVVSGDTLERISIKLYGKGERWDDIYEVNREKIGTNPHALKVNMILTLPDEPTRLSTAASN